MIPDVGWRREGEGENVTGGELEIVAITYSQLPIPNYLFPITYYLLFVYAIEQPKTRDNPDKVSNSGVSIGEYHKYV